MIGNCLVEPLATARLVLLVGDGDSGISSLLDETMGTPWPSASTFNLRHTHHCPSQTEPSHEAVAQLSTSWLGACGLKMYKLCNLQT
jgi:hypothetical protein